MWKGHYITITQRGELLVMREGHLPSHTHALYDVFYREGSGSGHSGSAGRDSLLPRATVRCLPIDCPKTA